MTEQLFPLLKSFITLFSPSFIFHLMKIFFLIQIQFIYIKTPHSVSISLWFKMVFLQYKNLINTARRSWTGNGKHANRYFISGSQSTANWYHWKEPSFGTGNISVFTARALVWSRINCAGPAHRRPQLQNLCLLQRWYSCQLGWGQGGQHLK